LAQRVANGRVVTVGLRLAEEDEPPPPTTLVGRAKKAARQFMARLE
jgi:hypothetical protein